MNSNDWRGETYAALQLASTTSQWPSYATFADLQKRGLRKEAMVQLRPFADSLADQALAQRWAFVSWLCSEVLAERVVTQPLVPMPLRSAVVVPTLFEQRDADPGDPRATIWLVGRFTAEVYEAAGPGAPDPPGNLLREQLANTPDDVAVRQCLARHLLRILEDDAHHLSESRYLGDVDLNERRLIEIRELLPDSDDPLRTAAEREGQLLYAWQEFCASAETDFNSWCVHHNVEPPAGNAYYYEN